MKYREGRKRAAAVAKVTVASGALSFARRVQHLISSVAGMNDTMSRK